ncbi:MAG: 16S rRNA (cytidine(1402)-2'-O)-methyltransferase [Cyclobacteriaceae bacterium]|nr:16S rRNA (cytidine(1402)-2'-O)-methyltransferase [Cyclobacteriaceae bacterium HetDA_MAG_MS6]
MHESTSLFLIPTPIGNLADFTYRAVHVLQEVDMVLAEDTRTSGKLLKHYQINTPMQSFHAFNEHQRLQQVITEMQHGKTIALISDAGTPGISDPGFLLTRAALENSLQIEALPGASALLPALLKSGFATDRFTFEGFLPHKKGRQSRILALVDEPRTMIFYESPHRLLKTLQQFSEALGEDRRVSVSRELTKKFEETITGQLKKVINHFQQHQPKGEFVVVIEGKTRK